MSDPSQWAGNILRPPLQPRDPLLDHNNMKTASPPPVSSSSSNCSLFCKRLNSETPLISKRENEPLSGFKRQKTKSSSELMESESNRNGTECFSSKGESTTPLCEWNGTVRNTTLKSDFTEGIPLNTIDNPLNGDDSKSTTDNTSCTDNDKLCNFSDRTCGIVDGIKAVNGNAGNMSPNCAATLEYVTQLPEGCSSTSVADVIPTTATSCINESDDDLEDDDNYLDSSEPEDNEFDNISLTNNEDDDSCCEEDDQSVISSVTVGSTSSLRSIASETVGSIYMNENGVASNEDGSLLYNSTPSASPLPPLNPSLFTHVPPTINFCHYNETTTALPNDVSRLLRWRQSRITPPIVRKTILNSGYKITKKAILWCGVWGKHMKSPCFRAIKDYQKVNHFPGTFQIGRKDKLWKNFAKFQAKYGKEEFGFMPKTFVLPGDLKALKSAFDKEGVKKKWIVKPPASARGTGIEVVNKWNQLPTETPVVVQRYVSRPYLINNTKFDIRLYVLVTSFHPLRIFLYEDGLVRFASVEYQNDSKSLGDRFMHLTNYSINKSSSSYTHNDDAGHCQGHKWTLKTFWGYLKAKEVDTGALWSRIADLVIKTFICGEQDIVLRTRRSTKSRYTCFEVFGFDVILDEKLRPWLLEVNISPSLHSASSLDHSVKGPLIANILNIAGFHIPDKLSQEKQIEILKDMNLGEKTTGLCLDRRLYTRLLLPDELLKHNYINTLNRSLYLTKVLEDVQPDDVRHLLISEDQLNRSGKFTCIFPTADTHQYFAFMDKPRYYNRLLDAWENTYGNCKEKGLELLENLCKEKIHMIVPQRFKLPKVGASESSKGKRRRPVRLLQANNLSQCSTPSGEMETKTNLDPPERETVQIATTTPPPEVGSPPERKKSRHSKVRVSANPLHPATVKNIFNVCAIAKGQGNNSQLVEEEQTTDEEVDPKLIE